MLKDNERRTIEIILPIKFYLDIIKKTLKQFYRIINILLESDHLGKNIVAVKVWAKASGIEVNFAGSRCYHCLSN